MIEQFTDEQEIADYFRAIKAYISKKREEINECYLYWTNN